MATTIPVSVEEQVEEGGYRRGEARVVESGDFLGCLRRIRRSIRFHICCCSGACYGGGSGQCGWG